MVDLGRREFLRIVGLAGTATAMSGCSEPTRQLIPYIIPPEDIVPGKANWYASTCRQCPAGCGLLAKNRDGRIIKVEGNPLHPVSGGKLCARGQASLHELYNPDRFISPFRRASKGAMDPISWDQAEDALANVLKEITAKGRGERIVFITELITDTERELVTAWLAEMGQSAGPILYEPFAYEPLRKANQVVFGQDAIPAYKIDQADFLISFNAGFLETWLSNVEYARQFTLYHTLGASGRKPFVFVGPRLSMTGNNADLSITVAPGDEYLIALGMLRVILDENLSTTLTSDQKSAITAMTRAWSLEQIAAKTGVSDELIRTVARRFAGAQRPLALAEGLSFSVPNATQTAVAANLLCALKPGAQACIDFGAKSAYSDVAGADRMREVSERMKRGDVELLLVYRANPVFSLPPSWEFEKRVREVPMVASFSSLPDETTACAHLVLPSNTPLETWGDYSPRAGITGLLQPVMGNVFDTRPFGDTLIATGKKVKGPERFPWKDSYEALQASWTRRLQATGKEVPFEAFWAKAMEVGGLWEPSRIPPGAGWREVGSVIPGSKNGKPSDTELQAGGNTASSGKTGSGETSGLSPRLSPFVFPAPDSTEPASQSGEFLFTAYPTVQFFDGRQANSSWMQELPDPLTMVTWDGWVEINPETAQNLGIEKGDIVRIKSQYGSVDVPAVPIPTVPFGTLAMPIGQGHTAYGRYAGGRPGNPMRLFPADVDPATGGLLWPAMTVTIEAVKKDQVLANVDGSYYDYGRGIVQVMSFPDFRERTAAGRKPEIDIPLAEGYDPRKDFYPPHPHVDYRWAMIVDLDRCIGCSACVVACYAENNLAVVGKDQVSKGRIMSWLRIERFFDPDKPVARWLPMLCQHCENAPCEAVCPVYAPHHSKEGLNNQVYNRCIGTRFCLQNDPYKVRRFNWFTFPHEAPLNMQLNPDVTARQKGVMEKCSFCIQRIAEAKIKARNEGRKVRDAEFTTACAQTCPTDALVFGNLMDPDSRVWKLIHDTRAYQVLGHLNTKPAVIYLKRVTHTFEV
jgi:molybdopterin-containing oxidoreductase family iron-sulfur binding subunit